MNEQDFLEHTRSLGYGKPQTIELNPNVSGPLHTHEFSVIGLVLSGSVTIAFEDKSVSNEPGEFCEIPASAALCGALVCCRYLFGD